MIIPLLASNPGPARLFPEIAIMLASPIVWIIVFILLREDDRPAAIGFTIFMLVIYAVIYIDMHFFQ